MWLEVDIEPSPVPRALSRGWNLRRYQKQAISEVVLYEGFFQDKP